MDSQALQNIAKKDKERKEQERARREEWQEARGEEDVKKFCMDFKDKCSVLQSQIQEHVRLGTHLPAEYGEEVSELETSLTQAAYYLPSYDLKSITADLTSIKILISSTQAAAAPRRKFAFSTRTIRPTEVAIAAQGPDSHPTPASQPIPLREQQHQPKGTRQPKLQLGVKAAGQHAPTQQLEEQHDVPEVAFQSGVAPQEDAYLGAARVVRVEGRRQVDLVVVGGGQEEGSEVELSDLERVRVWVQGYVTALRAIRLVDCDVAGGPVQGSCYIEDARQCSFRLVSRQVRIHQTRDSTFHLLLTSQPIIEHCTSLRFGPLTLPPPPPDGQRSNETVVQQQAQTEVIIEGTANVDGVVHQCRMLGFGADEHMGTQVQDFGWIKAAQSPNW